MEVLIGATILMAATVVSSVCGSTKEIENDDESEKIRLELLKEELIRRMK